MNLKPFQKLTLFIPLIALCGFVVFKAIRHSSLQARETLKEQLKEEIRKELTEELSKDVSQLVKKEMDSYLTSNNVPKTELLSANIIEKTPPQKATEPKETAQIASVQPRSDEFPLETKEEAITRIVKNIIRQEMRELTQKELSQMVASGFEDEIKVAGITKHPQHEFELAQAANENIDAKPQKNKSAKKTDSDVSAGAGTEKAESLERALIQRGGILLPKGKLQIEPSITYAHFSSNRISIQGFNILPVLVIGSISTEKIQRDIFINTWSAKYGLLNNFQTEVKVPIRWEYDRHVDTFNTDVTNEAGGLGDIEFGVSRQIGWEHGFIPDLLANLSVKTDSGQSPYNRTIGLGTGHWSVRGGLTAVKSSDPAVIFGGINYTMNIKRDVDNFGELDPGDSIGYSLGTAIALSYQTAINFSFDHSVTSKLIRDKRNVPGTFINSASVKTGFTWAINERSSVDFGVSVGLTTDSPDMTVELRFPYTF